MRLNNKRRFIAWLLALAFTLPILIKAEHLMFPNHEHHCHSCEHKNSKLEDVCKILEFDYFIFSLSDIISIPLISVFEFKKYQIGCLQLHSVEQNLGYTLRAPPFTTNS